MSHDPREELREIALSIAAYVEWQKETGADGFPRGERARRPESMPPPAPLAMHEVSPESATSSVPEGRDAVTRRGVKEMGPDAERAFRSPFDDDEPLPESKPAPSVAPPAESKREPARALPVIAAEVASCTKCGRAPTRTNTVFSRGNPQAALCFIGEAPGADEDAQGLPFVGRAGQLLDKMIAAMGLNPETDVYVCNIIKCRPPENRKPTPDEMDACMPYLQEQLANVTPKVIVAMGNTAVGALLGTKLGITKVRGSWKLYGGKTPLMPTFHPSYLLRPGPAQAEAKKQAWEDLQQVMKKLGLESPKKK